MTDPTRTTPAETALVDALLRADPMLDADEAQHLLSALAAPVNRDALVAWQIAEGIAVHDGWRYPKAYWSDNDGGFKVRWWGPDRDATDEDEDRPDDAVPLYRFNQKGDRG